MSEGPETRKIYCTHCQKDVLVTLSAVPPRGGQANLPDHHEAVCLDFGQECDGEVCPISRQRPVVMGVRLARSGLREEWTTVRAQCEACGQVSDLEVLDAEHAYCTLCSTTNSWMVLELEDDGRVVVTGRKRKMP